MATTMFHVGQQLSDGMNVDVMVERLAMGGFGEVAMGPDQLHKGIWWALKALRPDLLDRLGLQPGGDAYAAAEARLRASFLKEALTWVGLWPHPNLLRAEFVTQINSQVTLVLDYAEQGSLRDMFNAAQRQGGWFTLDTALHIAQQIATGLVALHTPAPDLLRDWPIVHRDLKPENILVDRHGYAMITDFGLAKGVADAVTTANSGAMLGTPAYMAPEQWRDASQAEPPTDAYAFGLIVAELLTERHPLLPLDQAHSLVEWREAHLTGRAIPMRQLGARGFAEQRAMKNAEGAARQEAALGQVEGLVARLLAKQAEYRPSMEEALAGLQAAAVTLGEEPYTPPTELYLQAIQPLVFWFGWAAAYTEFGLYSEALPRIERARALAPEDSDVLNTYARILAGLGRLDEAVTIQRQALTRLPEGNGLRRAARLSNIGGLLSKLGRYAEAEAAYAEATRLAPTFANAWYNWAHDAELRAVAEQATGRMEAARAQVEAGLAHIAQALRLNSEHPTYRQVEQALLKLRNQL